MYVSQCDGAILDDWATRSATRRLSSRLLINTLHALDARTVQEVACLRVGKSEFAPPACQSIISEAPL